MTPWQLEVIYALMTQSATAIFFGAVTLAWFLKIDCVSLRKTGDYRRIGGIPMTHHIPEIAAYFFVGQLLKVFFIGTSLPDWWLAPILVVMTVFTYRFAPGFASRFDCPLPKEHPLLKPLVMGILDLAALLGFLLALLL